MHKRHVSLLANLFQKILTVGYHARCRKATQNAWKSKPRRSNWTPKRTIAHSRLPPRYSWAKVGSLVLVTWDDKPCKCRIQKMDDENFWVYNAKGGPKSKIWLVPRETSVVTEVQ
eukprot:SAG22_NODE_406_length_10984_cov_28.344970_2_plen_115_part_00